MKPTLKYIIIFALVVIIPFSTVLVAGYCAKKKLLDAKTPTAPEVIPSTAPDGNESNESDDVSSDDEDLNDNDND